MVLAIAAAGLSHARRRQQPLVNILARGTLIQRHVLCRGGSSDQIPEAITGLGHHASTPDAICNTPSILPASGSSYLTSPSDSSREAWHHVSLSRLPTSADTRTPTRATAAIPGQQPPPPQA